MRLSENQRGQGTLGGSSPVASSSETSSRRFDWRRILGSAHGRPRTTVGPGRSATSDGGSRTGGRVRRRVPDGRPCPTAGPGWAATSDGGSQTGGFVLRRVPDGRPRPTASPRQAATSDGGSRTYDYHNSELIERENMLSVPITIYVLIMWSKGKT